VPVSTASGRPNSLLFATMLKKWVGGTPSGWTVPFGRWLYANVSSGLDRWLFLRGTYPSWMHRARVAADRRFGRR
jgi:hypothetical protein